jgi:hypothetical protein
MIETFARQDAAFYESLLLQHGVNVATRVPHVNHRLAYRKF